MRQAGRLMGCFRSSLRSIVYSVRGVAYVLESNMKRLFLFLPLVPAVAWSDDFPQYDGSEIVVTASRIPEPVSSAIGDISVITQAEIEKSGQSTLVELLRTQPGVEITSSGGFGQISAVQMRGASSRHTLVLIDGMRIDSASAGTTAFQNIPLDQIDHIEILRGPESGLYGSDAIGGVIQIFTKRAEKNAFSATAGYGGYNTRDFSAGLQEVAGKSNLSINAGYMTSDGFPATRPGNFSYNPYADAYRNANASMNYAFHFSKEDEAGIRLFQSSGDTQFADTQLIGLNHQVLSSYSLYSKNRILQNWNSLVRLGRSEDHAVTSGNFPGNNTTYQNQYAWQNEFSLEQGSVTAGLERLEQHVSSDPAYTVTKRTVRSVFGGYEGQFGKHSFQADVRMDKNSQYGSSRTGNAGYAYRINQKYRARANVGTAFKAPTFDFLYYPGFSNPNLLPERSRSHEVGLDYRSDGRHAGLTYFDNRITDLIVSPPPFYLPSNVDSARIRGLELVYQEKIGEYSIDSSLTLQDPVDSNSGMMLQQHARHFGSARLSRKIGAWDTGMEWYVSGYRYNSTTQSPSTIMGGYGLVNLTLGRDISKSLRLDARWNNLLNKRYELVQYYNTPGSNLFVSLTYKMQ